MSADVAGLAEGSPAWLDGAALAAMRARGVQVCRLRLDAPPDAVSACRDLLSPDERERAGRFHFERDARRYVVAHGVLRAVLGRELGHPPAAIALVRGPHGKPHLADGGPRFNLSHSDEIALIALHATREVGVDVERARPLPDMPQLAALAFAPAERAAWEALPPEARTAAFFRAWTRTEALAKARGGGFGAPARDAQPGEWVTDFEAAPGFAAALALC